MLVPVAVLPRPLPGTIHIYLRTVLKLRLPRSKCSGTHQTRLRCVFRREGVRVDRSAINLDTSTESRSPEQTYGRFSFRGPCRLAHKMAVRETRLTRTPTHVKTYPKGSGHFSATTRALLAVCDAARFCTGAAPLRPTSARFQPPSALVSPREQHARQSRSHRLLKPVRSSLTIRPTDVPQSRIHPAPKNSSVQRSRTVFCFDKITQVLEVLRGYS